MSKQDVDTIRSLFDAVARDDAAAVLAFYDEDVEWDDAGTPTGEVGGGRLLQGLEAVREWFRSWEDVWEEISYEVVELIDAGPHVVSVVTMRGRGRTSGLYAERPQFAIWTVRDERVVRVAWFPTREAVLEAAGIA